MIRNNNATKCIYRVQAYDSIRCGFFVLDLLILCQKVCICLLECTQLFSPNEYKNNDKIILEYF